MREMTLLRAMRAEVPMPDTEEPVGTEWVDDVPATTVLAVGIDPDRRPSEAMIRRLLQALDPDLLTTTIGDWLTGRATAVQAPATKRAVAVDGKTLRGSRTTDTTVRHVLAACDQDTGCRARRH